MYYNHPLMNVYIQHHQYCLHSSELQNIVLLIIWFKYVATLGRRFTLAWKITNLNKMNYFEVIQYC